MLLLLVFKFIVHWTMMGDNPRPERRRWASDTVPNRALSTESSPARTSDYNSVEEFVEVTLDLQDDNTIVLRSVEPATVINVDDGGSERAGAQATVSASAPTSRSTSIRRSSSNKLRQFSQELKAEAVAKARQLFSNEFRAELVRRFSWGRSRSHGHASRTPLALAVAQTGAGAENGYASAMEARARRRERAQLDRTRSGAQKALRGLRFISTKTNGAVDAWNQVQSSFNVLAKDGFLYRSDFAQCIGTICPNSFFIVIWNSFSSFLHFLFFSPFFFLQEWVIRGNLL
jgi:respiratory burst oxidase